MSLIKNPVSNYAVLFVPKRRKLQAGEQCDKKNNEISLTKTLRKIRPAISESEDLVSICKKNTNIWKKISLYYNGANSSSFEIN